MTGGCVCMRVHCVCVSEWRLHWRGGLVSDRKANWQAQTHRSGESMGPARAYLLPMMKPNTMNTSMMVPATATTAMMMTGFCSLETIAADEMDTHTKEKRKHFEWTSAHQTTICRTFGNWAHWVAWRLITCPTPHPFPNLWESGRGTFLFLSCPYTHGSTVSESGLNSPRRRQRCPSSQTKTHSGWIVSHAQLSLCSDSLHWQTSECNRKKRILVHFRSSGSALCKYWEMQYQEKSGSYKKSVMCLLSNQKSILAIIYLEKNFTVILHTCRFSSGSCGSLSRSRTLSQPCLDCKLLTLIQDTLGMWLWVINVSFYAEMLDVKWARV